MPVALTRYRVVKPFPFYGRYLGSGERLFLPRGEAEAWLASGHVLEADTAPEQLAGVVGDPARRAGSIGSSFAEGRCGMTHNVLCSWAFNTPAIEDAPK